MAKRKEPCGASLGEEPAQSSQPLVLTRSLLSCCQPASHALFKGLGGCADQETVTSVRYPVGHVKLQVLKVTVSSRFLKTFSFQILRERKDQRMPRCSRGQRESQPLPSLRGSTLPVKATSLLPVASGDTLCCPSYRTRHGTTGGISKGTQWCFWKTRSRAAPDCRGTKLNQRFG